MINRVCSSIGNGGQRPPPPPLPPLGALARQPVNKWTTPEFDRV